MPKLTYFALAACLLALGCGGDSPADPAGALVFQGTISNLGRARHDVSLPDSRLGRVTVSDLRARLIQVIPGFEPSITLGFSLGRPAPTGECVASFSAAVAEGSLFVFGLEAVDYCLEIFDTGALPEDAIVDYTLTLLLE